MFDRSRNAPAQQGLLVPSRLRTPHAAAIAGIVFSVLFIGSLAMLWRSLPADPRDTGPWLLEASWNVSLALSLLPFAGIAFFWFLGVLRDRLGENEDKFFATVFLGSGLLFLGMMFVAATAMGALVQAHASAPDTLPGSATFAFVRAFTYDLMHIYVLKMAAVFMVTTFDPGHQHGTHGALDRLSRLRLRRVSPYRQRLSGLGLFRFSVLGSSGQRLHPPRQSVEKRRARERAPG